MDLSARIPGYGLISRVLLSHTRPGGKDKPAMSRAKLQIQTLVWGLEELADIEDQERVWTGKAPGEMSSFAEALTTTFDSSGLDHVCAAPDG